MSRGNKTPENSERVEFKLGEKEITSRGNKRPVNSKRVPSEIEIASSGNKRPVNSERVELKPGEKELVSSCLLTLSLSCLV